jgi:hypothetical protein
MSEQNKSNYDHKVIDCVNNTKNYEEDTVKELKNNNEEYRYVVLMETSGEECESWYYCIKYEGNQKNLHNLQEQLELVDWYILDDLSTFDLDLDHFITEKTAKELTKLELNHHSFHRKFDGILDKVDLNIRSKDKNEKKMVKVFDVLGYGQIEDYIDGEDLDEEDLTDNQLSSSEEEDEDDEDDEDEENVKPDDDDLNKKVNKLKHNGIPVALQHNILPRFVKDKRRQHRK